MTESVAERPRIEELPIKTVTVIAIKNGQLLTVRHKAGTTAGEGVTGFPGGRMDGKETEKEAAVREFKEETGLDVSPQDLVEFPGNQFKAEMNFNGSGRKKATMKVFIATRFTGDVDHYEGSETQPEWVPLKRINSGLYQTPPNVLEAIHSAQKYLKIDTK